MTKIVNIYKILTIYISYPSIFLIILCNFHNLQCSFVSLVYILYLHYYSNIFFSFLLNFDKKYDLNDVYPSFLLHTLFSNNLYTNVFLMF